MHAAGTSMEELERAWTEGTPAARRAIFSQARATDPTRARAWLEATWSSEKAEDRAALLAALRTAVSAGDEPFVEAQLRDRASLVREAAQTVLAHLPESAFVRRMTARADAMLDFRKRGTLAVSPPEGVDEQAERDGLGKPPQGTGARAFWLTRALSAVPVGHWTARFGVAPKELVAAGERTDWAAAVCEGWARAAIITGEADWLAALWDMFQRADDRSLNQPTAFAIMTAILQRMAPADAAARVEALLGGGPTRIDIVTALRALPAPWPASLGTRWVDALRHELQGRSMPGPLLATVRAAALALPRACFERAIELGEALHQAGHAWAGPFAELTDVLRIRQELIQEIAS
jgi:hypothetical protein